ncbi:DUF4290 domain-containing protein [Persicobacter psychrovividus]|uniref:DUF4290 domain-containing protein n=1 Tax=Persicobacter psychrovividus TaxID=387638 RepID=A0ABM7VGP3_9BACT|nr:hypothetical protein PEPS_21560 [Persicobacter psychrovividus]
MHNYNTTKSEILQKEYGRNIQELAAHVVSIEDRQERTKAAFALIHLMKELTPNKMKDSPEYAQRLWDDLYIITDFKLDVDAPFECPEPASIHKKPQTVPYLGGQPRYRHYGRNIENMIAKASEIEDEEELIGAVVTIGKLMKIFYLQWNRDNVDDRLILDDIKRISRGSVKFDNDKILEDNLLASSGTPNRTGRNFSNNNRRRNFSNDRRNNNNNRNSGQNRGGQGKGNNYRKRKN